MRSVMVRVSPSHPYNAGRAGLGWGGVWVALMPWKPCIFLVRHVAVAASKTRKVDAIATPSDIEGTVRLWLLIDSKISR